MDQFVKYSLPFVFLLFMLLSLEGATLPNSRGVPSEKVEHDEEKSKLDPGELIIDHLVDQYSWHIITIGETDISIPLPVILYSKDRGFFCFMSSKFNHGHDAYNNFKIAQEGDNEGDIVELTEEGNIKEEKPLDFSITKIVAAVFFSIILMVFLFVYVAKRYTERKDKPPKGIQSFLEPLILFVRNDLARDNIGEEHYERFTPFLLTLFFFILINNLLGLIPVFPAGANVTGNITVTMSLALFTFIMVSVSGNKQYWREIFNPPEIPWWLKIPIPLIPVIEFVGIFIKPFVLMVRLFANISAGHIVMLGFVSLIFIFGNMNEYAGYGVSVFSVLFTIFLTILELLVAFIQAYVFTMLSAIYFNMALGEGH
ncbi:MAG: F0F1 ATP synthase subunit A [Bacteroidales bacterium]